MQAERNIITRLTALWAISESGLGGFMHAVKIPFTGFFLGGFAIVIITAIAAYSSRRWQNILRATLLVMLIKAAASPHSPPAAYLAVAFQGVAGGCIYSLSLHRWSAALFGMIALAESALQKVIVMTLIFGKNIWEALDAFFNSLVKDLHLSTTLSFSMLLIIAYATVYMVWGAVVGWWAAGVPGLLRSHADRILAQMPDTGREALSLPTSKKKSNRLLFLFFTLLFILLVFFLQDRFNKMSYVVLRTAAALLLLYGVINPMVKWLMSKWLKKQESRNKQDVTEVLALFPELKSYLKPALSIARKEHKGLSVYAAFIINWIVLSLYKPS